MSLQSVFDVAALVLMHLLRLRLKGALSVKKESKRTCLFISRLGDSDGKRSVTTFQVKGASAESHHLHSDFVTDEWQFLKVFGTFNLLNLFVYFFAFFISYLFFNMAIELDRNGVPRLFRNLLRVRGREPGTCTVDASCKLAETSLQLPLWAVWTSPRSSAEVEGTRTSSPVGHPTSRARQSLRRTASEGPTRCSTRRCTSRRCGVEGTRAKYVGRRRQEFAELKRMFPTRHLRQF